MRSKKGGMVATTIYKASYALYRNAASFNQPEPDDSETYCAWCHKSVADIKKTEKLEDHLYNHAKLSL